ncbi:MULTISPECIES: hypothetical protein [Croceitalea]|uniref:Tetratricopeptide repeat protein n=1 Tax=Croceitalea vernalis TaxID=3075599 RepID=A0ABU3BC02_9FLAO|nr:MULTISPECIES: hypothetical protein [unclassified Croceitalea]MDT0538219.1 hypothetical protein [Croceitalea sp. P059]MDT0620002.1 hypothetical protein [Croceitalea sp. P007]
MNVADFIHILQKSDTILSPSQTRELEEMIEEYPYFQAARALHLKGLKNLDSYKYNNALKITAAHSADREVLFDFITTPEFTQNEIANSILGRTTKLEEKEAISEEIEPNPDTEIILGETEEKSALPQNIKDAEDILNPELFETKEVEFTENDTAKLEIGKPLPFTVSEKHSFNEWLQLTSKKPIHRSAEEKKLEKQKKFDLLDKFIENKPRIIPKEDSTTKINIKASVKIDQDELMTETLAKVYLEQKKYKKAIQAFKILSLKYPEKSGFFADQIRRVKNLQKENE